MVKNSKDKKRKFAFVPPRFGENIAGGAETLVRELASELAKRGDHLEIWTTCAKDNRTWHNDLPAGKTIEGGLEVLRFPVDPRQLDKWIPLQIHISEGMNLPIVDQLDWLEESVNSKALYQHISEQADNFDYIFFAPYLFGTTFWGSLIRPDKSVLIPCLHNESFAYLDVMAGMFSRVSGCLFNTAAEMELAHGIFGNIPGAEVGKGFNLPETNYVTNLQPYFKDSFPYLIYLGRKETGKNVQTLIDYFLEGKANESLPKELQLVICGGGSFSDILRPKALESGSIIDLEHVSEQEKLRLLKYALCLCQPSLNESFSIVLMEAWSVNTPVLVHGHSTVTRSQVVNAAGGLYFTDSEEFNGAVRHLLQDTSLAQHLAISGKEYVESYYAWSRVLERFDKALDKIELANLNIESNAK